MILKSYSGEGVEDSRGIVFVKTRELARAIVSWMKETPGLRELNPIQFLGQSSADKGGQYSVFVFCPSIGLCVYVLNKWLIYIGNRFNLCSDNSVLVKSLRNYSVSCFDRCLCLLHTLLIF